MDDAAPAFKIYGKRYRRPENDVIARSLVELRYASFPVAMQFYAKLKDIEPQDAAFLACNDRFFLLTTILGRADAIHEWLYYRCREVEEEPDGHIDLWARMHYKSTIITYAGAIQEIIRNPEQTVLILSFRKDIAQGFVRQIKETCENSNLLHLTFPDVFWISPKKEAPAWSVDALTFKRKSNRKEFSIASSGLVDGMPTSVHYGLLIYDDVVTDKSVTTPEMVTKTTTAFELSDNLGSMPRRKWVIGTRYSFNDSYGIMIARGAMRPRIYPATHNGQLDGKPVFMTEKAWSDAKRDQRSTLAAQMLQNPLAGNENMFDPRKFLAYEVRPTILNVYIMCDPSKGKSATSDRTAFAVIGIDVLGNKYLLDGYRHRMRLHERWVTLKTLYQKWKKMRGVVDVTVGYEAYGMQSDNQYFEQQMLLEKLFFDIKELNWPNSGGHSKKDRVERLEPDIRNGKFFMPLLVSEPGVRQTSVWSIDEETNNLACRPIPGMPRMIQKYEDAGLRELVGYPIRRINEDRKAYDLTLDLIEEMTFFPFAPRDDLVDAVSRIYDLDPIPPPNIVDQREMQEILGQQPDYVD